MPARLTNVATVILSIGSSDSLVWNVIMVSFLCIKLYVTLLSVGANSFYTVFYKI